jgi:ribA/ribD-fused uncharacterized protein
MPEFIIFFSRGRQLAILSNFAPHPMTLDGHRFSCGEAYFHFAKFMAAARHHDGKNAARLQALVGHAAKLADKPSLDGLGAKRLGGKGKLGLRLEGDELAAWDQARDEAQRRICEARLSQGGVAAQEVRSALLGSGLAVLVHFERGATADTYWGGKVVGEGTPEARVVGQNALGRMWMEMRARLASLPAAETVVLGSHPPAASDPDMAPPPARKHRSE